MANQNIPASILTGKIIDEHGQATPAFIRFLQDTMRRTQNTLNIQGQITAPTEIAGRAGSVGSALINIDAGGVVLAPGVDLARPYTNKTFQHIDGKADLGTQVENQLASVNQANNCPTNVTNFCTVDSIDNGVSATVRVYGIGGVGTTWTRLVGTLSEGPYPALSQAGLSYATVYYVMFDPVAVTFSVTTSFANSLDDKFIFCGKLTTVSSGGGGGTSGGGGSGGGSGGCVEIDTPVIEPDGTEKEILDCNEWIGLQFPGHSPVNMHPDTMVCVWKKAGELCEEDRISVGKDGRWRTDWRARRFRKVSKKVKRTCPGGRYWAGTAQVELHNMKAGN